MDLVNNDSNLSLKEKEKKVIQNKYKINNSTCTNKSK